MSTLGHQRQSSMCLTRTGTRCLPSMAETTDKTDRTRTDRPGRAEFRTEGAVPGAEPVACPSAAVHASLPAPPEVMQTIH